ncbi:hypothetical protein QJS10_CPA06g01399 [Acorus calamus]|uniref:Uncharacterized protein n=1 Tax=Acorus calamus TaxID=4465 RepID=A0AAV9ELJ0_ACOCL|nr:hypothetical protein QJS10_CPA06g01399 [Acorus calamus]
MEADLILNSLLPPNPGPARNDNNDVPITAELLNMQTMNTQYFINNCDSVSQGLSTTLGGLRWMVFEDILGQDQMAVAATIVANENLNWTDCVPFANGVVYGPWEFEHGGALDRRETLFAIKISI